MATGSVISRKGQSERALTLRFRFSAAGCAQAPAGGRIGHVFGLLAAARPFKRRLAVHD